MKRKSPQPKILYPTRLLFRCDGEIKSFTDEQKLRVQHVQTTFTTNVKGISPGKKRKGHNQKHEDHETKMLISRGKYKGWKSSTHKASRRFKHESSKAIYIHNKELIQKITRYIYIHIMISKKVTLREGVQRQSFKTAFTIKRPANYNNPGGVCVCVCIAR